MVETTGSTSTFVTNAGAGGAVAEMMLVWRAAMRRYSAWSRQTRPSAEVQSSTRDQKNEKSVGQVDWRVLSAHRWVRQSASRSGSTPHPQVTDQSLFDEHERCGTSMIVGNNSGVGVDRPPGLLSSAKSTRRSRRRGVRRFTYLVWIIFGDDS